MTQEQDISKLDLLFTEIDTYRSSKFFKRLIEFCARFKTLAPYNAMLVRFQMPGARYVLTSAEWRSRYHRGVKAKARPLIILVPFGPVNFVFDIKDTYPLSPDDPNTTEQILKAMENPYATHGEFNRQYLHFLENNLQYHGIAYNPNWETGSTVAGELKPLPNSSEYMKVYIPFRKGEFSVQSKAHYVLSTSSDGQEGQTLATIAHELGHLFCNHLPAPKGWKHAWTERDIESDAKEFEAEVVSWFICDRLGIKTPSHEYLSGFLKSNDEIPKGASVERIFYAITKVWEMCNNVNFSYRNGLLYKNDEKFQDDVKATIEKYK